MKKIFTLLLLLFSAQFICAQQYYDPYPITSTQTFNGSQYKIECSVYDTSLATTFYYNSSYYDTITFSVNSSSSIAAFGSQNFTLNSCYAGCITYDFEIHQWKTYIDSNSFSPMYPMMSWASTSGSTVSLFIYTDPSGATLNIYEGYYDIIHHGFRFVSETFCDPNGYSMFDGLYTIFDYGDGDMDGYMSYFTNGSFIYMGYFYSCDFPNAAGFEDLTGCSYDWGCGYELEVTAFDAETGGSVFSYTHDASYISENGMYIVSDYKGDIYYHEYDAAFHTWESDSLPGTNISGWKAGQNAFALKDNVNHFVISGVYNFNQHKWIIDSTSTTAIDSLKITEGTVKWKDASGTQQIRGYDPTTGWGNYSTTLTPMFYVSDVAAASGGNLIFIRDYSIGATGYQVDFGDGIVNSNTNNWHLYKKNGSYLYLGSPLQDTICYTVTNSSGSATSCIPIKCFKPIASITASSLFFCNGDSVLLSANSGLGYQWIRNGNAITNATSQTYYASVDGKYQCVVTDSCTSKYSNVKNIISLPIITGAAITAVSPTTACRSAGNIQLSAGPSAFGTNYHWFRNGISIGNSSSDSLSTAPVSGNYYCVLSNSCGADTTNGITFNILGPTPVITAWGSFSCCIGDSIKLTVNTGAGYTYQWANTYTGGNIPFATDTFYYAKVSGYFSCNVSDSVCTSASNQIYISVSNIFPYPSITALGPTTFCSPGSVTLHANLSTGVSYQWLKNGIPISSAVYQNYSASSTGLYRVDVTNSYGCDSTSLPIFVNVSCLTDGGKGSTSNLRHFNSNTNDGESVYIYPNPVLEKFKLEYSHANQETITVSFFDLPGKKIMEKKFDDMKGFNSHELNVQHLAAGTYFMEVNFSSGKKIFKLIKE